MIVDQALYDGGRRHPCDDLSRELARLRRRGDREGFIWIGLINPAEQELLDVAAELDLHPLAVEDAIEGKNQRAKIELYDGTFFMVLKTIRYVEQSSDIETGELMAFVGDHFVLTLRRGAANELQGVRRRLEADPDRLRLGALSALHAIVDSVVDNYVVVDAFVQEDLDQIEAAVFAGSGQVDSTEIYRLKREVLEFKRAALPLTTPLQLLQSTASPLRHREVQLLFRDVFDHLNLVGDHLATYDSLLTDILSAHLTQVSVRQNEDMRKISAWVAIASVPTMIAGIYGTNFDEIPELHWRYGHFAMLAVMLVICTGLFALFKRNHWL